MWILAIGEKWKGLSESAIDSYRKKATEFEAEIYLHSHKMGGTKKTFKNERGITFPFKQPALNWITFISAITTVS